MKTPLIALASLLSLNLAAQAAAAPDQNQDATQKPPTTFRAGLDLIAIDVQVIDREGIPVTGLGPDKFEVTINGKRRRVVSADLVESRSALNLSPVERAVASGGGPTVIPMLPRVVVIAIDCLSFDASASRHILATARDFIDRLPATDEVGLFAYPYGPKFNPTLVLYASAQTRFRVDRLPLGSSDALASDRPHRVAAAACRLHRDSSRRSRAAASLESSSSPQDSQG